jgi:ABC-type nitrate/sulfonate/bicarbonate transport system permease component
VDVHGRHRADRRQPGLGYRLSDGRDTGRADIVLAAIVLLAALAGGGAAR